ncbi:uncharacterized protein LOC127546956 [Antechinus flavipes]|uniref:uncharacterized protein LOC127546956 n=1 Tax=Antechinus flavipes TaxID=38775 RepID=UPI0022366B39|nr:uncharacterized protein LOC127546956 [Antechinus flavipes]
MTVAVLQPCPLLDGKCEILSWQQMSLCQEASESVMGNVGSGGYGEPSSPEEKDLENSTLWSGAIGSSCSGPPSCRFTPFSLCVYVRARIRVCVCVCVSACIPASPSPPLPLLFSLPSLSRSLSPSLLLLVVSPQFPETRRESAPPSRSALSPDYGAAGLRLARQTLQQQQQSQLLQVSEPPNAETLRQPAAPLGGRTLRASDLPACARRTHACPVLLLVRSALGFTGGRKRCFFAGGSWGFSFFVKLCWAFIFLGTLTQKKVLFK